MSYLKIPKLYIWRTFHGFFYIGRTINPFLKRTGGFKCKRYKKQSKKLYNHWKQYPDDYIIRAVVVELSNLKTLNEFESNFIQIFINHEKCLNTYK